jgi:hypothetical protein
VNLAIVQPYLFPYIGYFQLIDAVEIFVLYDDVNFITRGWINRNKVLVNGKAKYLTIPCKDASQHKLINETQHALTENKRGKLLRMIRFSYSNAPFFDAVFPIVKNVLKFDSDYIVDLAEESVRATCNYLSIDTNIKLSSSNYDNVGLDRTKRILDICSKEKADRYINPPGGKELYKKSDFKAKGIELKFIEPELKKYPQFNHDFVLGLSIIDVLMFNDPQKIRTELLTAYKLV